MDDDEWDELHDFSGDYLRATEYLSRRELGLAPGRDELTARQEQVILFVAGERQRQMQAARGHAAAGGDPEFAEAAEPEEQDVSDAELMAIAARARRR